MRFTRRSLFLTLATAAAASAAPVGPLAAQAAARTEVRAAAEQGREYHLLLSADHEWIADHAAVLADLASSPEVLNIRVARQLVGELTTALAGARAHHAEIDTALAGAHTRTAHATHMRLIARHDAIAATLTHLTSVLSLPPLDVDRPAVARDAALIYWEAKGAEAANREVRGMRGMRGLTIPKRPS